MYVFYNLINYLSIYPIKSSLNIISKLHILNQQKMISRNASGSLTPKVNIDNLCVSLSQKDKIIFILQKQLQGFRNLRENYERLKDRKNHLLDKCESMNRQININRNNQDVRVDNSQKYVIQLKMLVTSLQTQLQNKQYQLKNLKYQAQSLIKSSQIRQSDLLDSGNSIQSIKSSMEVLKMESGRLNNQIGQTKEQIQRIKNYQIETESARQKIKNQIHNTQTFLRQLGYQQSRLTQNLSNLQDQNNSIDLIISDYRQMYDEKKLNARDLKDLKQSIILKIKTKELQKGRIQTQFAQKQKQLKAEKEKQKSLNEVISLKKNQIQRLSNMLKQVNEQSEQLCKNNMQVESINIQLQRDLSLSQKHFQSVVKNNQNVKTHLQNYYKTNVLAIKKLRKPMDEGWVELGSAKRDIENLDTTTDGFLKKSN